MSISSRLAKLEGAVARSIDRADHSEYRDNPVGFIEEVLHYTLTEDQKDIARACCEPPYRVKVRAGHSVGKTFLLACLLLWWHHTRPISVVITTAPTERDVIDLLWAEVRLIDQRAGLGTPFVGPSAPHAQENPEHWAKGYTARKGESFQGRHRESMLFIFDEDEGVEASYWKTASTMFDPSGGHLWISCGNPTTTTSQSAREESKCGPTGEPKWRLFTLSCLNHPNVIAGMKGEGQPIPNAVSIEQVHAWVEDWCSVIDAPDKPGDFEWPIGSGTWRRPGPEFQSRVKGERPSDPVDSIWSDAIWKLTLKQLFPAIDDRPELGVDVARYGDDSTCIHGRCGPCSFLHESGNGWSIDQTVGRVKVAAAWLASEWNEDDATDVPMRAEEVRIKVDDDGVGGGVSDYLMAAGYTVVRVQAGSRPVENLKYGIRRDEIWFSTRDRAIRGELDLTRLTQPQRDRLMQQALMPRYEIDSAGRRRVESKDSVKARTKSRSPDDMDAMNLAYLPVSVDVPTIVSGRDRDDRNRPR